MSSRRFFGCLFFSILLAFLTISPSGSTSQNTENSTLQTTALIAGRNINMISGKQLPEGDPFLQRQNEPSIAVSSRNPMHILAGANDYRTVDLLIPYEEIPGYEGAAVRDAWLGLYKSFDGGQSWKSSLLPGFPLDYTIQGSASPLKAYGAAADPVVRAGTSGMFYYCGLAFNRNQTENSVFVARLIDNNNSEDQSVDSIKYIDAKIIDKGNAGQFIDKPWLAVDIPRSGAKRVTIQGQGIPSQTISAGNVYLAYSIFTGQAPSNPFSRVYLARSIDCGTTWEKATKLSESSHVNQGVTIAISPATGYIYVAWRRFAHGNDGHAIMFSYSTDGGKKFSNPKEVAAVQPFDQGTTGTSFRTNTYPALTVDHSGIVYLAWAQRGVGPGGDARIVVSTSGNGINWSTPQAVDNHGGPGHQFMPALSYSASKVTAVWYDQRYDVSQHWHSYISDEPEDHLNNNRHTIDVRAAQAVASASPVFEASAQEASVQVSRYLHLTDADGELHQVQFSPPNYPMFKEGTRPFHGDYVDLTPVPMFLPVSGGGWTYNTDGNQSPVFHAAWTDNRNVKPPKDGYWSNYAPPSSTQDPPFQSATTCEPGQTSMRNQDVYIASLTRGLIVGSPVNMKPLDRLVNKHTFVVFVKNMTDQKRRFRLTIMPVTGVTASFKQFTPLTTLPVEVARYSSVSRTVFATGNVRFGSIRVDVEELDGPDGNPVSGGLKGYVVLNPDIENPDIENPDIENNELHNPDIENPNPLNPDIENVNVLNPDIENPDIENPDIINPDIENPDIENPDIENPDIENPGWLNPDIENPDIVTPDIENGSISDYTWKVANTGNTASAYAFKMISAGFKESQYPGFGFQLLIYRVHTSPAATSVADSCVLTLKHHDELIANIIKPIIFNPDIENPDIENPDIENPDIENATFWLAPDDKAYITLRVYDPNKYDNVKFDPAVTPIAGVTTGQAVNSANENDSHPTPPISSPITTLTIWNSSLPNGTLDTTYRVYLVALGGKPHYTWSITSGSLPDGLSLNAHTGAISGTPTEDGTFSFTIQVVDSSTPTPQTATKAFSLLIAPPCSVLRPNSPTGTGTGGIGINYTFTIGGSTDSEGHAVEYRLDWGDGTFSDWITTSSESHAWAAANPDPYLSPYEVKVQSHCHVHPSVVSAWSSAKKVSIFNAVSTISGTLKYNGNPITNMPDASGKEAVFWLLRDTNNWVVPISATYDKTTGNYSIPNIPEGQYSMTATIDAAAPYDGKYYPGDYNGYAYGIIMPASPVPVTKDIDCQKLLHLVAPIDNAVAQHWPGPVYDAWPSPIVLEWGAVPAATTYRYWVDKYQSSDLYPRIEAGTPVDTAATRVSLGLPASGTNDHYQFNLYAYSSTGSYVGKFMIVYTSGCGWDYRFRIVVGGTAPEINLKQGATNIADGGSYDYGPHVIGTNTDITFTIENTGSGNLALNGSPIITITGANANQFSVQQQPSTPVSPSSSTTFITRFRPTSAGIKTASISILNDDSDESPYDLTITGAGSENYVFEKKWGSLGGGDGQFYYPSGIAADSSGNVYVADTRNNRIQKFTSSGVFLGWWGLDNSGSTGWHDPNSGKTGESGSGDGQFYNPYRIAVDSSGNVYVADTDNNRIQKFTSSGTFVTKWGSRGSGDGQFLYPHGIAVDSSGNVYVVDTNNNRIQKFTSSGIFVTKWGNPGNAGDGDFYYPYAIAVDSSSNVYVVDTYNFRIQKFTSSGTFITKWGAAGTGDRQFNNPDGIAVDSYGDVYVADTNNNRIQKFTSSGAFVTKWGSAGSGDGQFNKPYGIAVDSSGDVYVADTNNSRIQKFRKQ